MGKRSESRQVGTEGLGLFEQRTPPSPDPGGATPERGERRTALTLHRDPLSRTSDPETSHLAGASMREEAQAQRQAILAYLLAHPSGATADALDKELSWRPSTAGRRLSELIEMGVVFRCDGLLQTPKGHPTICPPKLTQKTRQGRWAFVHMCLTHLDWSWRV